MKTVLSRRFAASLFAAAFLGFIAASFSVDPVAAAQWQYWIAIPANSDGANAELRCGYHELACGSGTWPAVDWGVSGNANDNVYFRGAGNTNIGYTTIGSYAIQHAASGYPLSGCTWNTVAEVHNYFNTAWQMSQVYVHTINPRNTVYLYYGNPSVGIAGVEVADMVNSLDPSGCGWGGQHVHSYPWTTGPLGIAQNGSIPTGPTSCCPYPAWNNYIWAQYFSWSY